MILHRNRVRRRYSDRPALAVIPHVRRMEQSVPEALFTTDSTERGPGNAVDTGAASAERRSLRRKAHPTTVSNIEELLSMGSSLSESRVSAFPRFPGSNGLPGTPSPAGLRRQPKCVVDSTTEGSLASLPKSFKPTRFARSRATRRRRVGSSLRSRSGLGSGHRR